MGTSYIIPLDLKTGGVYTVSLMGSSTLGELAQIPCTLFTGGLPMGTFVFTGTNGKDVTIEKKILLFHNYSLNRLYIGQNGVRLKAIKFSFEKALEELSDDEKKVFWNVN